MHPDLEKLVTLQTFDVEIKRLRDEMVAIPKRLAELEAKATSLTGQRAVVLDLIAREEVLRRRLESDVKDQQIKIERTRKKVESATTTAMVTAFEHEIAFAQAEISRLEDTELESMERSEALEAQKKLADKAVDEASHTLAAEKLRGAEIMAADKIALAAEEAKRAAQRPLIGETALSIYDRISKSKITGVAEALNQQCAACRMMIRPQRWNDLRNRDNDDDMMTCESCGRLLYYDPARDAPQRKTVQVESIAAQIIRSL